MYTVINSNFDVVAQFESYTDAVQFVCSKAAKAALDFDILEDLDLEDNELERVWASLKKFSKRG